MSVYIKVSSLSAPRVSYFLLQLTESFQCVLPSPAVGLVRGRHTELGEEVVQGRNTGALASVVLVPGFEFDNWKGKTCYEREK